MVRQPRRPSHRQPGDRPERAHRRRGLRDPRPTPRADHPGPPDLRVPLVHQTRPRPGAGRARRRLRPPGPLHPGETQLLLQHRPLCRRHHRAKTHGRWTYTALDRGTHVWTSPHGYQYLRDQHGTLDVSATDTPTRRIPAPTPGRLTPPPRTPPDHHRRGPRHVRGQSRTGSRRRTARPARRTWSRQARPATSPESPHLASTGSTNESPAVAAPGLYKLDQRTGSGHLGSVEVPASGAGRTTTSRPPVRSQASPHGVHTGPASGRWPGGHSRCLLRLFGACTPTWRRGLERPGVDHERVPRGQVLGLDTPRPTRGRRERSPQR